MVPSLDVANVTFSAVFWSDALMCKLLPDEIALMQGSWAQKRKTDFILGRAAARDALAIRGINGIAVLKCSDDGPLWPDGIVGSIAHTAGIGIATVASSKHYKSVGVDLEAISLKPHKVIARIACEEEILWIKGSNEQVNACMLFAMKEALYKALAPQCKRYIGFKEVMIEAPKSKDQNEPVAVTLHQNLIDDLPQNAEVKVYCATNTKFALAVACIT